MKQPHLIAKVLTYFNLENQIDDFDVIHESIVKDVVFKGTNLWILMFAIVVASVGLNMNSTAVIIGAMLISPLMGPINGVGYSISTYNFPLLRKSLKNMGFAVLVSIAASTAYFALSPISTAHSELLARTSPTIYDVLIALFGGLAGIIAITSKLKGNVIPGVAIATALMPPLCTAGYGLATGQFYYFFGAMFLFTINSVFIAISSVIVSQILKFPIRTLVDESAKKRVNRSITLVIILVAFPSIYFGYNLVQKEKFIENTKRYIANINIFEGNYLLKSETDPDNRTITLVYGGVTMQEDTKERIRKEAVDFDLSEAEIFITQGLILDIHDKRSMEIEQLRAELNRLSVMLKNRQEKLDSITVSKHLGQAILKEIKLFYPTITSCAYAESFLFNDTLPEPVSSGIILFSVKENEIDTNDQQKIHAWLQQRLHVDRLIIHYSY